jgi:FAD/FMN-containing dehydrogenase
MDDAEFDAFAQGLRGTVVRNSDADYDDVRKLYNASFDKRPRLIVRCADVADVMAAVRLARETGLPLAIRGGGHNGAGLGSVDDGLLIDLSQINDVRVDPKSGTARVGAGCTTGQVDHATHPFGLAIPFGIISTTGVAGLTLSGGHGYLGRKYGLASDNLIEADVVLADGSFVVASETDNADLLWGLKGGGGNFGVVTSFLFRAKPVSTVYGGPIIFDLADAAAVMRWYRDFQADAPDDFYVFLGLQSVPPGDPFPQEHWGKKMCVLVVCHTGDRAEAEVNVARAALPTALIDWCGPIPYPALQKLFDPLNPPGMHWYWKGDFVQTLSDAAIDAHIANARKLPGTFSLMHLYPIDGAVHRKSASDSAWNNRSATWSMVIAGIHPDATQQEAITRWARDYWNDVHPFNQPGAYPNFMMADEGARLEATFGDNYPRLQAIKGKYDPGNLFRVNHNIRPAS